MPPTAYQSLWPYWDMAFSQFSAKGSHLKENTIVSAEFNLYRTNDETLLWSGETDTVCSENFGKLAKEYADTVVKQLKKTRSSREVGGVSRGSGLIQFGDRSPPFP